MVPALLLAGTSLAAEASVWRIETSPYECFAEWNTLQIHLVLLDNEETRRICREVHPDLACGKPILMWSNHWFDVWDIAPETYDISQAGDNVTFDVQVRLFPDEQQGFFAAPMSIKEEFEGYEREFGHSLVWWGFDLHDRLQKWGTAKETSDDPGVRIPEVRLILRYEKGPREGHGQLPDYTRDGYLDVPLWRTSNMMNKMLRCSGQLEEAAGSGASPRMEYQGTSSTSTPPSPR